MRYIDMVDQFPGCVSVSSVAVAFSIVWLGDRKVIARHEMQFHDDDDAFFFRSFAHSPRWNHFYMQVDKYITFRFTMRMRQEWPETINAECGMCIALIATQRQRQKGKKKKKEEQKEQKMDMHIFD